MELRNFDFIILGGGIAGVSCTEYLSNLNNDKTICLISSTYLVKAVCNIRKIARTLEQYEVTEKPLDSVANECGNVTVVRATVVGFEPTGICNILFIAPIYSSDRLSVISIHIILRYDTRL
jgi:NADH dehydrogenase FAD-containing subunit